MTSDDAVDALRANKGELSAYGAALDARAKAERTLFDASKADLSAFNPKLDRTRGATTADTLRDAEAALEQSGLDLSAPQRSAILDRYRQAAPAVAIREIGDKTGPALRETLRDSIRDQARAEAAGPNDTVNRSRERFRNLGFDPLKVEAGIGGGKVAEFIKALEFFDKDKLSTLDKRLSDTAAEFARLQQAVIETRRLLGERAPGFVGPPSLPVEHKAAGGVVGLHPGRPKGADRIPAWLADREFVVNARSAEANRTLLERINAARGPVHLADGGDPQDEWVKRNRVGLAAYALRQNLAGGLYEQLVHGAYGEGQSRLVNLGRRQAYQWYAQLTGRHTTVPQMALGWQSAQSVHFKTKAKEYADGGAVYFAGGGQAGESFEDFQRRRRAERAAGGGDSGVIAVRGSEGNASDMRGWLAMNRRANKHDTWADLNRRTAKNDAWRDLNRRTAKNDPWAAMHRRSIPASRKHFVGPPKVAGDENFVGPPDPGRTFVGPPSVPGDENFVGPPSPAELRAQKQARKEAGGAAGGQDAAKLAEGFKGFGDNVTKLTDFGKAFDVSAASLGKSLDNFPRAVEYKGTTQVVVSFNGGGDFLKEAEGAIGQMIQREVAKQFADRLPDAR